MPPERRPFPFRQDRKSNLTATWKYKPARLKGELLLSVCLLVLLAGCVGYTPAPFLIPTTTALPPATLGPQPTFTLAAPSPIPGRTEPPGSPIEVRPADLRGVRVEFWRVQNERLRLGGEADVLFDIAEEFNRQNPWGVRLETRLFPDYDRMYEQAQAEASGNLPELIAAPAHEAARLQVSAGTFIELGRYMSDPVWGFSAEEQGDFYDAFWAEEEQGEGGIGIPLYRSAQVLFYNAGWAAELGLDEAPENPPRFKAQACLAARANRTDEDSSNDRTGGWLANLDAATLLSWMQAYEQGGVVLNGEGYRFHTSQTEKAFVFLRGLFDEGCAWTGPEEFGYQDFADRKSLFMSSSLVGISEQEAAFAQARNRDDWTVLPYPSSSGSPVVNTFGPSLMVMKSTPEQELAAWLVLKWLVAPEAQARLVEATNVWPVRPSALALLEPYRADHPQWEASIDLLPFARREPLLPSWSKVRWVVADAAIALFGPRMTPAQIPGLLETLDETAAELDRLYQ